jgi:hypothetical protein
MSKIAGRGMTNYGSLLEAATNKLEAWNWNKIRILYKTNR